MEASNFIDYYEILEVSPNANSDTIDRMFRYLALRYHPDNSATSDRLRFDLVLDAHNTLKDPAKRVQYDMEHKYQSNARSKLIEEISEDDGVERDVDIQNKLLSLLYVKRRRSARDPGMGDIELEQLLGCPIEHVEFHLWYLKEKKWILKGGDGKYAITTDGVDRTNEEYIARKSKKLLTDQS